jgi:hypothetical protein
MVYLRFRSLQLTVKISIFIVSWISHFIANNTQNTANFLAATPESLSFKKNGRGRQDTLRQIRERVVSQA